MDVPPLFYACIYFCMGSGDPLHTPRALGTAGHLAGTSPHQWRGQGPLPFRRFPHQRVRSRLLFLVGLLLSPPPPVIGWLSQAQGKVSLRSSVLYFLAGRRSSASTSTGSSYSCSVCFFCEACTVYCRRQSSSTRPRRYSRSSKWLPSSRLTKCTASSRTTARSQSSATSLLAR